MNKYLEKVALRRIVTELAKGTVSTPLKTLADKGFIKPIGTYAKGMNEGNKAIAKKIGVDITKARGSIADATTLGGGYMLQDSRVGRMQVLHGGKKGPIHSLLEDKKALSVHRPAFVRHELFEAQDLLKKKSLGELRYSNRADAVKQTRLGLASAGVPEDHAKTVLKGTVATLRNTKAPVSSAFVSSNMGQVGGHATPRVLTRESEMVRKNPYLWELSKFRSFTGENNVVRRITGKRYGTDAMKSKDHAKAFSAKPDETLVMGKNTFPVFRTDK